MPIESFDGNTYVAFTDICGFKSLMLNREKAITTLRQFYQTGFDIIHNQINNTTKVEGLFISDCAVLFVRNDLTNDGLALEKLLKIIEELNKRMLESDLILKTSVCFGHFNYEGKFEISGIEKNQIFGNAYLDAFLDNEVGKPKLKPGECRIILKGLPHGLIELEHNKHRQYKLIKNKNHWYFYWMLNSLDEADEFQKSYNDSYNLQFRGMLQALKNRH